MAQGFGDRLARGEKTAIFPAGPDGVSQSKWDAIFADEERRKPGLKPRPQARPKGPHVLVDPELTVTAVFSWLRDAAIVYGVFKAVWNTRGWYQAAKDFKKCILEHMSTMEGFAHRAEVNHFRHMEEYLYKIAKDRNLIAVLPRERVDADDVEPPPGYEES